MNRDRKHPAGTMLIRITNQTDKHEGKEQGREKIKGAVLVAGNAVIRARLLSRQLQIDLVIGRDAANIFILENLQSGAETNDDTAAHPL